MTAPSVIPRAVHPRGQMLILPTKCAGNESEWDRGQEQTPIKAVEYLWQMEHTEQLINPFWGWCHVGDDEFDNHNNCITGVFHVMHITAVIPILRETEL